MALSRDNTAQGLRPGGSLRAVLGGHLWGGQRCVPPQLPNISQMGNFPASSGLVWPQRLLVGFTQRSPLCAPHQTKPLLVTAEPGLGVTIWTSWARCGDPDDAHGPQWFVGRSWGKPARGAPHTILKRALGF